MILDYNPSKKCSARGADPRVELRLAVEGLSLAPLFLDFGLQQPSSRTQGRGVRSQVSEVRDIAPASHGGVEHGLVHELVALGIQAVAFERGGETLFVAHALGASVLLYKDRVEEGNLGNTGLLAERRQLDRRRSLPLSQVPHSLIVFLRKPGHKLHGVR
jgi:hypothetical protein